MRPPTLTQTLRIDAAANLAGAAALVLLAPLLAAPAGLDAVWPLWLLAAVLAAYGLENWAISRRPRRPAVTALIATDALFAVAALAIVVVNPTGVVLWVRVALFVIADLALIAGALKTYRLRHPERERETRSPQPA